MRPVPAARPNILMIVADQHHAGLMGCAGFAGVHTPHLDALAADGLRFTRAYCQNPICTPSRVSILSGQYCQNHGYYGLSGPAPAALPNLFRHLRGAGYRTAAYGKLHLPEAPRNWIADDVDEFGDAYESPDGVLGDSEFLRGLEQAGLRDREDSWHNRSGRYGPQSLSADARPSDLPYAATMERWAADRAMAFMTADRSRPFCIQLAFQRPHHPLLPQREFWDRYPADLPLPATFDHKPTGRPPHFQHMWRQFREAAWDYAQPGETFHDGARRAWRGTLACITQMDDIVGRVRAFLREQQLEDNSIVIYGSDHGAYHGIHGLPEKAPGICSDAVCRVPMIWRVPGVTPAGATCDALVENIDLTPTLAALAGAGELPTADGTDLTPLLRGGTEAVKSAAVTENPWSKAIVFGRWRYVHYPRAMFGGEEHDELYDLTADPDETTNLARDPAQRERVAEARGRLLDWAATTRRLVTSHPAVKTSGEFLEGTSAYPLAADARAPAAVQPRRRDDNVANYL
ncbi:MAG: hypothetical protein RIS54_1466 [Verrucomicrobiota bacterium]|jgi:choline-sulfatase/uncharacterized sulfatase